MNLDKGQLKAIQDGQTWEDVSKEQKSNFDKVADAVNSKAESSDLSGYVTTAKAESTYAKKTDLASKADTSALASLAPKSELANKVDKDGSKVLSDQNFTTALKTKLDGIATNANNYSHPTTSGNKHIPSGGSSGQILTWASDGTAAWGAAPTSNVTPVAAPAKSQGANPTQAEFDALIDALIAAGVFTGETFDL